MSTSIWSVFAAIALISECTAQNFCLSITGGFDASGYYGEAGACDYNGKPWFYNVEKQMEIHWWPFYETNAWLLKAKGAECGGCNCHNYAWCYQTNILNCYGNRWVLWPDSPSSGVTIDTSCAAPSYWTTTTQSPTPRPSPAPSDHPSVSPTAGTQSPSASPTSSTRYPSPAPTASTEPPTASPTADTASPSASPTTEPITVAPTIQDQDDPILIAGQHGNDDDQNDQEGQVEEHEHDGSDGTVNDKDRVSSGGAVGIAFACIACGAAIVAGIVYVRWKKQKQCVAAADIAMMRTNATSVYEQQMGSRSASIQSGSGEPGTGTDLEGPPPAAVTSASTEQSNAMPMDAQSQMNAMQQQMAVMSMNIMMNFARMQSMSSSMSQANMNAAAQSQPDMNSMAMMNAMAQSPSMMNLMAQWQMMQDQQSGANGGADDAEPDLPALHPNDESFEEKDELERDVDGVGVYAGSGTTGGTTGATTSAGGDDDAVEDMMAPRAGSVYGIGPFAQRANEAADAAEPELPAIHPNDESFEQREELEQTTGGDTTKDTDAK